MRTKYEQTKRGRARRYTYNNALELAFLSALVKAGRKPAIALGDVRILLRQLPEIGSYPAFLVFTDTDFPATAFMFNTVKEFAAEFADVYRDATVLSIICVAAIVKRVGKYFEQHGFDKR
jgi:hypothetical protein